VRMMLIVLVAVAALVALPAASAKEFKPGDVRVCNPRRCVPIMNRNVLPRLAALYYGDKAPTPVQRPRLGVPYYELRYRNGYVTGIVASKRLDRFLSYGVVLGRFTPRQWYVVPDKASRELRRLTIGLSPFRLDRAAIAKSH